jgi:hypothetical protein
MDEMDDDEIDPDVSPDHPDAPDPPDPPEMRTPSGNPMVYWR